MTRRAFILSCDPRCRQCRGTALDTIETHDRSGRVLAVRVLCVCVQPLALESATKSHGNIVDAVKGAAAVAGEVIDAVKGVEKKARGE